MSKEFNKCLIKSPLGMQVYASVLLFFTVIFILILTQGRYGKQEMVKGLIRNESFFRVAADRMGNVLDIYAEEGQAVKKGAPLFRIALPWQDATDQHNGTSMTKESISRLRQTQSELQREGLSLEKELADLIKQKTAFFSSIDQNISKIDGIEKDYLLKKKILATQLKDYEKLLLSKSINKTDVENVRQYSLDNNVALTRTVMEKQNLLQNKAEKQISYARTERELLQIRDDVERRKRELINDLNKIEMQQEYIVTSPVDGIIHDVGILKGDFVDGKSPSMIVKTDTQAQPLAILHLTSSQIGLLDRHEKIFLRVDTFPYESYGMLTAHVVNVSKTPTKVSLDDKDSWFRVKLQLDEHDALSKIPLDRLNDGMSVTTSLRQPEQTLMEWLFLPVKKAFKRNPDFIQ